MLYRKLPKLKEKGEEIVVVSVEHEAGEKLQNLDGTAAPLRYPTT